MKDWFKGVGKSISDVFTTAFDFVWKYIGPYVTGIKNAFKMVVNAMKNIENVKMIAENVVTILKCSISSILFITSMITGGWEEAKENMIAVWDNIAEAAQTIWFGIKISFITLLQLSYSVTSIFNGLMLTIKKIWIDVKLFFTLLWIDIKYGAINVWIEIKYSIIETWINIKFEAIRIWESLKTWFFETVENIKMV